MGQSVSHSAPTGTASVVHSAVVFTAEFGFASEVLLTEEPVSVHVSFDPAAGTFIVKCTITV